MDDALVLSNSGADGVAALWHLRTLTAAAAPLRDVAAAARAVVALPPHADAAEAADVLLAAHATQPALLLYNLRKVSSGRCGCGGVGGESGAGVGDAATVHPPPPCRTRRCTNVPCRR